VILLSLYSETGNLIGICSSSPSVYVVFESIKASDGCNQIGPSFMSKTATFPPGALSTLAPDNSTQSFNLADLPCPPASVQWDSPGPYAPLLAPPPYLFDLDPAFSACIAGYSQGVDPPTPLSAARGVSGPGGPGHLGRKRTVVHAHPHAHARPWSPQKTA